jgi:glycosyltransferase involved in cell wall biosynthesis
MSDVATQIPPEQARPTVLAQLQRADALRDQRNWNDAAEAYAAYLREDAEAWQIWVQYGHCMKETGDPRAALLCYREAERLYPDDADVHLQIGHALKLLNRQEEAYGAYARALTLDPGNAAVQAELMAAGEDSTLDDDWDEPAPIPAAPRFAPVVEAPLPTPSYPTPADAPVPLATSTAAAVGGLAVLDAVANAALGVVVFDASDLFQYFRDNRAPTGIQRVQLNIIREALSGPEAERVAIAAFDPGGAHWKAVPAALFLRLADLSRSGTDIADPAWASAVEHLHNRLDHGPAFNFTNGASLVNLGTSWWLPDYLRRVREIKAAHGVRYIPFIHDCIPLIVPEHCGSELVDDFARWFAGICLNADAVLTNSRCTAEDFQRLRRSILPEREIQSFPVPLDAAPEPSADGPGPLPIGLTGRAYVLFVATIESRKNHLLVFNAWLGLIRKYGATAVPDLVCVGKNGWLADAALSLHGNSAVLKAKVRMLHDIPDTTLEALYRGCLFTLYNSFYEGWGLPVTESLAFGKIPLIPEHSSLTEAGGASAVYFAPQSEPSLIDKLERLIHDPDWRRSQEQHLLATRNLRRWSEVAEQLLEHVARAAATPRISSHVALPLGEVHALRLLPGQQPTLAMAVADSVREGPGWSPLEPWGAWARLGEAALRLALPPGSSAGGLRVYLEIVAPPEGCRLFLRVAQERGLAGTPQRFELGDRESATAMLTVEATGADDVLIEIGLPLGAEPTEIGVRSVMVCRADDVATRLDYLEARAFGRK